MSNPLISRLYELADELYRCAPWEWMEETQLVALRHPQEQEIGHLSVMGMLGSHRALAVYLGQEALERFNRMHSEECGTEQDGLRLVLESRQLQLSFNERAILDKADLAEIKALGRKYRGESWPQMRSFRPGYVPQRINDAEALWLTLAVEQMLAVVPRLKAESSLRADDRGSQILCRTQSAEGRWHDEWLPFHDQCYEFPRPACDAALAARLMAKAQRTADIECLFTLLPSPIGKKGGTCMFPYLLMAVEADTGFILGVELFSVETQTHAELIAAVPDGFLRFLEKAGVRPRSLACASVATANLLHHPGQALGVKVQCYEELPLLDQIVANMPL